MIVPARDAEATLPRTLAALADQEGAPSFEVVVVDDGSSDGTAAIAERSGARLIPGGGGGTAEARNAGAAAASGALLAFCDADCRPSQGWLAAGTRALADADLAQGRVAPEPSAEEGPFASSVAVAGETGWYHAGNLFVTRALFDRLGGFERPPGGNEAGPGQAGRALGGRAAAGALTEAVWFGWRARRAGVRTAFCADALSHRPPVRLVPRDYVAESGGLQRLPHTIATLPELRDTLLHRRLFLSPRTMKLDLALAGLAVAAARRSKLPLLLAAPYALELRRRAKQRAGDDWKTVAGVDAAADLAAVAALVRGSISARTPVL